MASKVKKVQLIKESSDISHFLAPTGKKVSLTILFTAVTILLSLVVGVFNIVSGNEDLNSILNILFIIINFGGGIGNNIYTFLNGLGFADSGNFLIYYGVPILLQFMYLYFIICASLPASKHKSR